MTTGNVVTGYEKMTKQKLVHNRKVEHKPKWVQLRLKLDIAKVIIPNKIVIPSKNLGYLYKILIRKDGSVYVSRGKGVNIVPEVWHKLKKQELTPSGAVELAKMSEAKQKEIAKYEHVSVDAIRDIRRKVALGKLNLKSIEKAINIPLSGQPEICPRCGSAKKCNCPTPQPTEEQPKEPAQELKTDEPKVPEGALT